MAVIEADRGVIRRAQDGDGAAMAELAEQYGPQVRRISRAVCMHADNADEVSQETLLALVRSLKDFRAEAALTSWLYSVARHACLKCRRRARPNGHPVASLDTLGAVAFDHLVESGANPEAELAHAEALGRLHAAIRALEPAQRDVLVLRDVAGASAADTARALGISVPAVKSRLHRAREHVRVTMLAAGACAQR